MNNDTPQIHVAHEPQQPQQMTVGAGRLLCRCSQCDYWITLARAAYEPFAQITGLRCSSCGKPMMVIDLINDPN